MGNNGCGLVIVLGVFLIVLGVVLGLTFSGTFERVLDWRTAQANAAAAHDDAQARIAEAAGATERASESEKTVRLQSFLAYLAGAQAMAGSGPFVVIVAIVGAAALAVWRLGRATP